MGELQGCKASYLQRAAPTDFLQSLNTYISLNSTSKLN